MSDFKLAPIDNIEQAIDLLVRAFAQDPMILHFAGEPAGPTQGHLIRQIVSAIVQTHKNAGHPILGLWDDRQLEGCALVQTKQPWLNQSIALFKSLPLWLRLPRAVFARMNDYARISQSGDAQFAPLFLAMIGIDPDSQGAGLGTLFFRQLEDYFDPEKAWYLDTENPKNIPYYEKLGFELYEQKCLEHVVVYKLRKN